MTLQLFPGMRNDFGLIMENYYNVISHKGIGFIQAMENQQH